MARTEGLWTIEDLCARAALALASGYAGQRNGQVREIPDVRTVRYYATLGLVDRPAEFRGRTALYGHRHLLQVVAIKRLQARGLPLVRVQEELLGLAPRALARLAAVDERALEAAAPPAGTDGAVGAARTATPPAPAAREFWKAAPASRAASAAAAEEGLRAAGERAAAMPLQLMDLAPAAALLLRTGRAPAAEDIDAIRAAAAPLVAELMARGLIGRAGI